MKSLYLVIAVILLTAGSVMALDVMAPDTVFITDRIFFMYREPADVTH